MDPVYLYLFLLGVGTGVFGAMVGTGGGVVLVPALLIFFGVEPTAAAGTSLALVPLSGIPSASLYVREKVVDIRSGLLFAAAAVPGSVIGPFAVREVQGNVFRVLLGALIVSLSVYLLYRSSRSGRVSTDIASKVRMGVRSRRIEVGGETYEYKVNEALGSAFNVPLGFLSSFFGIGGGFLRTPILVAAFGFPVRIAAATSLFALAIYATVGAGVHLSLGHVEWPTFLAVGPGLLIGSPLGVWAARRVESAWLVVMLASLLLVMGTWLVWRGAA